jgi:hypothetical protein
VDGAMIRNNTVKGEVEIFVRTEGTNKAIQVMNNKITSLKKQQ